MAETQAQLSALSQFSEQLASVVEHAARSIVTVAAAIPAPSLRTSSSHAAHMILVGGGSALLSGCLSKCTPKSAMGGYKQGHCMLWADEAQDEWGAPDTRRETSRI